MDSSPNEPLIENEKENENQINDCRSEKVSFDCLPHPYHLWCVVARRQLSVHEPLYALVVVVDPQIEERFQPCPAQST